MQSTQWQSDVNPVERCLKIRFWRLGITTVTNVVTAKFGSGAN